MKLRVERETKSNTEHLYNRRAKIRDIFFGSHAVTA